MAPLDLWTNDGLSTLAAGIDATQTTFSFAAGTGGRFPTGTFNVRIWNSTDFANPIDDPANEIVRVPAGGRTGDNVTGAVRAQEGTAGSAHNTAGKTYSVALIVSKKFRDDLEARLPDNKPIVNADVAAGAAIAYSKLALAASIVNADINASAAIDPTKVGLIGVSRLSKTTGTVSTSINVTNQRFLVDRFAFGAPQWTLVGAGTVFVTDITSALANSSGFHWVWTVTLGTSASVTWDYLTGSGDPRIWAVRDGVGRIVQLWEAEDPAMHEWPDEVPLEAIDASVTVVPIHDIPEWLATHVLGAIATAPFPSKFVTSRYRDLRGSALLQALVQRQFDEHGLDVPADIREVYGAIADPQKRLWYVQKFLRGASRYLHDHRAPTLSPLLQARCRVSPTGVLSLA